MRHAAGLLAVALAGGWRCGQPAPSSVSLAAPRSLVAFDADGDGDVDVVVAEAERATLLRNDGGALRKAPEPLASGAMPSHVVAVDLEADGDRDLVFANHESSRITVLRNDGRGGFGAAVALDAGSRPHLHALVAADLDGDGALDLAVDSVDEDGVRAFLAGAAPARLILACDVPYYKLGAGDVTGDGVADLLVPCQAAPAVVVLAGPALAVAATVPLPAKPWVVAAADLDGDRRAEIVVVLDDAVAVLRGDAGAGFAHVPGSPFAVPGATDVAHGDLDGDGLDDLAVGPWRGDEVVILWGGAFGRSSVRVAERPVALAIADLDGDGRGELIAGSPVAGTVQVVRVSR
jgi:hypothetical protein